MRKTITNPAVISRDTELAELLLKNREWYAEIFPMTFGKFRIIVTDGFTVQNGW